MKRVISFLMTIALLFGMVGTTSVQVFAETLAPEELPPVAGTTDATETVEELEPVGAVRLVGLPECIYPSAVEIPEVSVDDQCRMGEQGQGAGHRICVR